MVVAMEQALLLNASYEPLKVVNWQKAITLWCQGKVEVIAVHDREIRAVSVSFKLPSVIRLLRFVKIKRRFDYVPFSRANIYARDNHTCQYCGDQFPTSELTFDQDRKSTRLNSSHVEISYAVFCLKKKKKKKKKIHI